MKFVWLMGITLEVFRPLEVGLGRSEPVVLIPNTKKVAATWFSSTMAMIKLALLVDGWLQRSKFSRLKSPISKSLERLILEGKERYGRPSTTNTDIIKRKPCGHSYISIHKPSKSHFLYH